jgi:DNA-directed RNA polymerase specialized sigma24 family protein
MVAGTECPRAAESIIALAECLSPGVRHRCSADAGQDLCLAISRGKVPGDVCGDATRLIAWVRGALRRRVSDLIRRERRRRQVPLGTHLPSLDDPSTGLQNAETAVRVRATLTAMRAGDHTTYADLLEWRLMEGKSLEVIAALLRTTPRRVTYRLRHAKQAIAKVWRRGGAS